MQTGALAAYNFKQNVLYLDGTVGTKSALLKLQSGLAVPSNPLSTYVHEYIHWQDRASYLQKFGIDVDMDGYLAWIRAQSKSKLDKLVASGYDIDGISEYAKDAWKSGAYDEAYTEYRVENLMRKE